MKVFEIITLFPQMFPGTLDFSIFKKTRSKLWDMHLHDLRLFGIGKNKQVDDELFSGIAGMLIRPDVIDNAMHHILSQRSIPFKRRIFLSPRGRLLNQPLVEELASEDGDVLILCGRYEGVDSRAIKYFNFEEISIGNYVLAGAEVAAQVLMEAVVRKIPGVIGNNQSFENETFANNEFSEDRYTRPAIWKTINKDSISVEEILLSGDHAKIAAFRASKRIKIE